MYLWIILYLSVLLLKNRGINKYGDIDKINIHLFNK